MAAKKAANLAVSSEHNLAEPTAVLKAAWTAVRSELSKAASWAAMRVALKEQKWAESMAVQMVD